MKKTGKILVIISVILSGWSCNFLEVDRLGKNDIPKFFSNVDGLRTALPGMYREFYKFYDTDYMKYSEAAADMIYIPRTMGDMQDQYDYTSIPSQEKGAAGNIWEKGYSALSNVNNILFYGPKLREKFPRDAQEIDRIMAEALFIRASLHLFICNCFGQQYNYTTDASHLGIPIAARVLGVNDKILRSSVKSVYEQITIDLNEAIKLFGSSASQGVYYASKLSCLAMLARVHQYKGEWEKARDYAGEVIALRTLTTGSNYINMFANESAADETIFRLSGIKNSSHTLRSFYVTKDITAEVAQKYVNTFYYDNDLRKQLLDGSRSIKYAYNNSWTSTTLEEDAYYAPIILRASEMYLIRAEAYCRLNQADLAAKDLKAIMARAQGVTVDEVKLEYNNTDDLMNMIERERILELSFEGHRFFDILRYKRNLIRDSQTTSTVKQIDYPSNRFVLPLTSIEIEANKGIQQNPGY